VLELAGAKRTTSPAVTVILPSSVSHVAVPERT
jgi:hypothetical protein